MAAPLVSTLGARLRRARPRDDTLHGDVGANALDGGPGQDTSSHGPSAETRTNCEPN